MSKRRSIRNSPPLRIALIKAMYAKGVTGEIAQREGYLHRNTLGGVLRGTNRFLRPDTVDALEAMLGIPRDVMNELGERSRVSQGDLDGLTPAMAKQTNLMHLVRDDTPMAEVFPIKPVQHTPPASGNSDMPAWLIRWLNGTTQESRELFRTLNEVSHVKNAQNVMLLEALQQGDSNEELSQLLASQGDYFIGWAAAKVEVTHRRRMRDVRERIHNLEAIGKIRQWHCDA